MKTDDDDVTARVGHKIEVLGTNYDKMVDAVRRKLAEPDANAVVMLYEIFETNNKCFNSSLISMFLAYAIIDRALIESTDEDITPEEFKYLMDSGMLPDGIRSLLSRLLGEDQPSFEEFGQMLDDAAKDSDLKEQPSIPGLPGIRVFTYESKDVE